MEDIQNKPIYNESGEQVQLRDIRTPAPTLIVFLRQGECIECTMMIDELQKLYTHVIDWNIPLIFIANGPIDSLPKLRSRLNLSQSIPLYTDPSLEIYKAAELHSHWTRSLGPTALWNMTKGWANGYTQTKFGYNLPQQSGVLIFNAEGGVEWIHKSKHIGDIPSAGDILEVILRLQNASNMNEEA